jgi:hypothetical protein
MAQTYYELLRDPRWQRKRLEIMKDAHFSCLGCGSTTKTLNIHHSYYEKGMMPWEYPDSSLRCLCEDCHKNAQDVKTLINRIIGARLLETRTLGYIAAIEMDRDKDLIFEVLDHDMACGIADFHSIRASDVINALRECSIDGKKLAEISKRDPRATW